MAWGEITPLRESVSELVAPPQGARVRKGLLTRLPMGATPARLGRQDGLATVQRRDADARREGGRKARHHQAAAQGDRRCVRNRPLTRAGNAREHQARVCAREFHRRVAREGLVLLANLPAYFDSALAPLIILRWPVTKGQKRHDLRTIPPCSPLISETLARPGRAGTFGAPTVTRATQRGRTPRKRQSPS
jgi:hypothetical protein